MRKAYASAIALAVGLAFPAFAQNAPTTPTDPAVPPVAAQNQPSAQIGVNQPAPQVNVQQPAPQITVKQPEPQVTVTQPAPQVVIEQPKPEVTINQPKPEVTVQQAQPNVTVQQPGQPNIQVQQPGQPNVVVKQPDQAGAASTGVAAAGTSGNALYAMRGEEIVGKDVYGANGEEIGEVENVVLSQSGGSPAVVVGVGGFLGIGERHVLIPLDQLQWTPDKNGMTTGLTKDSVKALEAYDRAGWRTLEPSQTLNDTGVAR